MIRAEAQKRWAASRTTANDYTSVVLDATYDEMTKLAVKIITEKAGG